MQEKLEKNIFKLIFFSKKEAKNNIESLGNLPVSIVPFQNVDFFTFNKVHSFTSLRDKSGQSKEYISFLNVECLDAFCNFLLENSVITFFLQYFNFDWFQKIPSHFWDRKNTYQMGKICNHWVQISANLNVIIFVLLNFWTS